jgi:alpha-tubulin suppressor-like RCC1 family protein
MAQTATAQNDDAPGEHTAKLESKKQPTILYDNGQVQMDSPTGPAPMISITAIAAGSNHNLALRNDGTVWAWAPTSTAKSVTDQIRTDL